MVLRGCLSNLTQSWWTEDFAARLPAEQARMKREFRPRERPKTFAQLCKELEEAQPDSSGVEDQNPFTNPLSVDYWPDHPKNLKIDAKAE